jgi:uncharacterized membrane-anchored protein
MTLNLDPIRRRARIASTTGELLTVTRQDVPALIAEIERLRAELAEARAATETNREVARVLLDELATHRPTA